MSLINCETCGQQIAKQAKVCPHCGIKRHTSKFKRIFWVSAGILLFLAIISSGDGRGLPSCTSASAISYAKDTMNEKIWQHGANQQIAAWDRGSNASVMDDEVIDINNAQETSYDEAAKTVHCSGVAETKLSGNVPVNYSFRALNDGSFDVQTSLRK